MRFMMATMLIVLTSTQLVYGYVGKAHIKSTSDEISAIEGEAVFTEVEGGIEMDLSVSNAWKIGTHPLNIYEFGDCQEMGKAAGNPFISPDETSVPTLTEKLKVEIQEDGSGRIKTFIPGLTLKDGPKSIVGRSLIIHEQDQDPAAQEIQKETPIGCGPIVITGN